MAEVLVCVRDMTSPDFYVDCAAPKRGDVICVQPDGFAWGNAELSNPDWRIIRLGGISVSAARAFTSPEVPTAPPVMLPSGPQRDRTLQYRGFKLDLDDATIPAAAKRAIADDARATPVYVIANAAALVARIKKQRAKIADPAVIGDDPSIIA